MNSLLLKPADRIVVPKSEFRLIEHHAIYLGRNHLGQELIIENKIGKGVQIITAEEFFNDVLEITRIEPFIGTEYERSLALKRAKSKLGRPYNLTTFNCQHFANYVQHYKAKSEQVETAGAFVAVCLVFFGLMVLD